MEGPPRAGMSELRWVEKEVKKPAEKRIDRSKFLFPTDYFAFDSIALCCIIIISKFKIFPSKSTWD